MSSRDFPFRCLRILAPADSWERRRSSTRRPATPNIGQPATRQCVRQRVLYPLPQRNLQPQHQSVGPPPLQLCEGVIGLGQLAICTSHADGYCAPLRRALDQRSFVGHGPPVTRRRATFSACNSNLCRTAIADPFHPRQKTAARQLQTNDGPTNTRVSLRPAGFLLRCVAIQLPREHELDVRNSLSQTPCHIKTIFSPQQVDKRSSVRGVGAWVAGEMPSVSASDQTYQRISRLAPANSHRFPAKLPAAAN